VGPKFGGFFKEKVYFLEHFARKIVVPGFRTAWHYDSKIAQSYVFEHCGVPTPATCVTFDYADAVACLNRARVPLVFKESHGAGSSNVELVPRRRAAERRVERVFCQHLWDAARSRYGSKLLAFLASVARPWLWAKIVQRLKSGDRYGAVYFQEFLPGNPADLRITVIGDSFAYAFWRKNRVRDFRASGSGRIDYDTPVPEEALRYCLEFNRRMGFDSMAYDILRSGDRFVITEMSFDYAASPLHAVGGYYELEGSHTVVFRMRRTWPQELWVEWALTRARRELETCV
jgi:glutathione synthase/RimK-type ligase-like ATP-grasp enzyme